MWTHTIAEIGAYFFFEADDLKLSSYAQKTALVCVCVCELALHCSLTFLYSKYYVQMHSSSNISATCLYRAINISTQINLSAPTVTNFILVFTVNQPSSISVNMLFAWISSAHSGGGGVKC